jgi:TM2 domain-containing membrane protein YozV
MIGAMSKALVKRSDGGTGVLPAVCSAVLPGLGQWVNGEADKGIGVMAVWLVAGAGVIGAIPVIGWLAGVVAGATWVYGVADGFVQGRKK